jgi:NADH:ubiquinone oxidoreductase subunit F (NADH-binding)
MTMAFSPTMPPHVATGRTARLLPSRGNRGYSDHLARYGHLQLSDVSELATTLAAAGLLGRGGAGFPTSRKLSAVAANSTIRRRAVVVVNCCEGDPTSSKDAVLLTTSPHLVIDGALLAAAATRSDKVILALHKDSSAAAVLRSAVAEREPTAIEVVIAEVPPRFVASEATSLVKYLNTGDARPMGRRSAIWKSGVDGRPTLVDNAETLAHIALIHRFGAPWFRHVGKADEPGTTLVTVGGAVPIPGVVEVATGTPLGAITSAAGWSPTAHFGPAWALVGGLAGRWTDIGRFAGTGFSTAELAAIGATKGVASITVLPAGGCVLAETARILQFLADAGARQCGPCMFGLPAIAADMADLGRADPQALARLRRRLPVIDKRGGCGHPDGAVAMAASALHAMTGPESAHLDVHARYGGCNAPAPITPLGAGHRPEPGRS